MIDVHTHILPHVDDGAADTEEAIRILKKGLAEGIKTFLLTPHIKNDIDWSKIDYIKETFVTLKNECAKRELGVELILGAEISITPDLPDKIKHNPLIIINERYALIELPFFQLPIYAENVLFKLLVKNIIPIIVHPERYMYLKGKSGFIRKWVDNGIMIQMNTGSLAGLYGMRVKKSAKKLLKAGLVHLIGSDIHADNRETYGFRQGVESIRKIAAAEITHKIIESYPEEVIGVKR